MDKDLKKFIKDGLAFILMVGVGVLATYLILMNIPG